MLRTIRKSLQLRLSTACQLPLASNKLATARPRTETAVKHGVKQRQLDARGSACLQSSVCLARAALLPRTLCVKRHRQCRTHNTKQALNTSLPYAPPGLRLVLPSPAVDQHCMRLRAWLLAGTPAHAENTQAAASPVAAQRGANANLEAPPSQSPPTTVLTAPEWAPIHKCCYYDAPRQLRRGCTHTPALFSPTADRCAPANPFPAAPSGSKAPIPGTQNAAPRKAA